MPGAALSAGGAHMVFLNGVPGAPKPVNETAVLCC
jgi:hypothetical protein